MVRGLRKPVGLHLPLRIRATLASESIHVTLQIADSAASVSATFSTGPLLLDAPIQCENCKIFTLCSLAQRCCPAGISVNFGRNQVVMVQYRAAASSQLEQPPAPKHEPQTLDPQLVQPSIEHEGRKDWCTCRLAATACKRANGHESLSPALSSLSRHSNAEGYVARSHQG